ncbi:MAG: hypothetical protein Q7K28_00770 [Candidatus Wildermuthbacteria bacterium]|nr:hypothetical protein [Candidatus Wildermuthbacteria bacterium]
MRAKIRRHEMAVGATARIELDKNTRAILECVVYAHDLRDPIFLDLASRLRRERGLFQYITKEEVSAILAEIQKGGSCLLPEVANLMTALQQIDWH